MFPADAADFFADLADQHFCAICALISANLRENLNTGLFMTPLLEIKNLSVDFVAEKEITHAVKNISLSVKRGEVMAIVGESGSGKTVTALSILQLIPSPPAKYSS